MVLTLYLDLLSQPSRSVWMMLKLNSIDFKEEHIILTKGEHKQKSFEKINPFMSVPYIKNENFKLGESVALMRYVAGKHQVTEKWFGKTDSEEAASIEEFLHWHHAGLRKPCNDVFLPLFMSRDVKGGFPQKPFNQQQCEKDKTALGNAFKTMETYFLRGNKFLAGENMSAADIMAFNEIRQLFIVGVEKILEDNKVVHAWYKRMEDLLKENLKALFATAMVRCEEMKTSFQAAKKDGAPSKGPAVKNGTATIKGTTRAPAAKK